MIDGIEALQIIGIGLLVLIASGGVALAAILIFARDWNHRHCAGMED